MTDEHEPLPLIETPQRLSPRLAWIAAIGVTLLLTGIVILATVQATRSNTFLERADCRASHQGEYDSDLARALQEWRKPQPDQHLIAELVDDMVKESGDYAGCGK